MDEGVFGIFETPEAIIHAAEKPKKRTTLDLIVSFLILFTGLMKRWELQDLDFLGSPL